MTRDLTSEIGPHVPERTCVACRKKRPQGEFLRLTKDAQGCWQLDAHKQARTGRGTYLCADDPGCGQEKRLRRTFGAQAGAVALSVAAHHQRDQASTDLRKSNQEPPPRASLDEPMRT